MRYSSAERSTALCCRRMSRLVTVMRLSIEICSARTSATDCCSSSTRFVLAPAVAVVSGVVTFTAIGGGGMVLAAYASGTAGTAMPAKSSAITMWSIRLLIVSSLAARSYGNGPLRRRASACVLKDTSIAGACGIVRVCPTGRIRRNRHDLFAADMRRSRRLKQVRRITRRSAGSLLTVCALVACLAAPGTAGAAPSTPQIRAKQQQAAQAQAKLQDLNDELEMNLEDYA